MHFNEIDKKKRLSIVHRIIMIGWKCTHTHTNSDMAINLSETSSRMQIKPVPHFCSRYSFDVSERCYESDWKKEMEQITFFLGFKKYVWTLYIFA